jgi:hypothetical protein
MFGKKNWESATATIVLVNIKRVSGDGLTPTREWAADVTLASGEVRRIKLDEPRWVTDFWPPDARDVVKVQHDPKSDTFRFDMSDPQLSMKGRDKAQADAFAAALKQNPRQ